MDLKGIIRSAKSATYCVIPLRNILEIAFSSWSASKSGLRVCVGGTQTEAQPRPSFFPRHLASSSDSLLGLKLTPGFGINT